MSAPAEKVNQVRRREHEHAQLAVDLLPQLGQLLTT